MNAKTACYLIFYGAFLIVMELAGFLWNPEKAKTALMSGGTFGALSILWGVLGSRGVGWSLPVAITTTGLMVVGLAWMGAWGWLAVMAGDSGKLLGTVLRTAMLAGSVVMLPRLLKA